jgi:subtilisin family serine protease/subtilase family serine protease
MRRISAGATIVLTAFALLILSQSAGSQGRRVGRFEVEDIGAREAVAREILVKFRQPPQPAQLGQLAADTDAEGLQPVGRTGLIRVLSRSRSATALRAALAQRADIAFAEPNYLVHVLSEPGDPLYPQLWGLKNIGQPVNGGVAGTVGADMRAAEAWDLTVGSASNVVAVVDTGIDYTHSDLAPNMWSAPAPFTVNIRGVSITCAAGTHGFNAITKTCNPMDDHNHGTHVAGTIGAVGNNGVGVAGVNWVASLMGLKFLDAGGSGTVADAIDAIDFALQVKQIFSASGGANIRVLSNSWGGGDFSQALLDEINAAGAEDILFVAAAGNNGLPNDFIPLYPASYSAPNIVAVAATTNTDGRAFFSNYGAKTVHLGAPGVDILSTVRGGGYAFMSGTSMATPHVSGAAALALSYCPLSVSLLKSLLVDTVDPVASMATTTISGGRLNVRRALQACSEPPATPSGVTALGGDRQVRLNWSEAAGASTYRVKRSATSGGPYTVVISNLKARQFTDTGLVNGTTYYYVVSGVNVLGEGAPSTEVSATPQLPADMIVSAFTVPTMAAAGSPLGISITAKNQGIGIADPSTTRFYISKNFGLDASDPVLTDVQPVPELGPGISASTSMTVTIPTSLEPGYYHLIAKVDADDVLIESAENNNTLGRSFSVGPDLAVSGLTVPATAAPGATIEARCTVRNQGADGAPASLLNFYWSANGALDPTDQLLATVDIGPLGSNRTQLAQASLVLPLDATLGTYYILARSDAGNTVTESSESNNNTSTTIRVGGDLVVSAFGAPTAVGTGVPFVVTDSTKNAGSAAVTQSSTNFYLSADAGFSAGDTLLGSRTVDGLAAGDISTSNTTLVVPSGTTAGTYYLFAKADGADTVSETQESNNTAIRSVKVGPDLTAAILSAPPPIKAGSTGIVAESVTNRGAGDAMASLVKYYLSVNFVLDGGDVVLPYSRAVEVLGPNETSSSQTSLPIPTGTAPGTYYLIVQADGGGTVAESSETNNTIFRQIRVE